MKPSKILLVEDEALFAMDLGQRLKGRGYVLCETALRGKKAVEIVEREKPDLVLMDINLKGEMSGIDAAREIRLRFGVPVIFMSGYSDEDTKKTAMIAQPAGYVTKPFNVEELLALIDSIAQT
jgi:two-component system, response regulator PdtaR